jgi:hypothetical protein
MTAFPELLAVVEHLEELEEQGAIEHGARAELLLLSERIHRLATLPGKPPPQTHVHGQPQGLIDPSPMKPRAHPPQAERKELPEHASSDRGPRSSRQR